MELFQLRYFSSVAKYENFSKAADELSVTQPSVSKAISSLERELGVPLFDRNGKKIRLNAAGRRLQERVGGVMSVLDNLPNELAAVSGAADTTVTLKVLTAHEIVSDMIMKFKSDNPSVDFRLEYKTAAPKYDLCFYSAPQDSAPGRGVLAMREDIMLAVSEKSELSNLESIDLCDVRYERFINFRRDGAAPGDQFYPVELYGYRPEIAFESISPYVIKNLVAAGLGISLWPSVLWRFVPLDGVRLLHIKNTKCWRGIFIAWPESGITRGSALSFFEFAKSYFGSIEAVGRTR